MEMTLSSITESPVLPAVIIGLFGLGLVIVILIHAGAGGLTTTIRLLSGRWKFNLLSGSITSIGRVNDRPPRHSAGGVKFCLDDGQQISALNLTLGPDLRESGAFRNKADGGWLVSGRRQGGVYSSMKLLGFCDGDTIYLSRRDLALLYNMTYVNALLAGIIVLFLAFLSLVLDLHLPAVENTMAANPLIFSLFFFVPFFTILFIGRFGSKKMMSLAEKTLNDYAVAHGTRLSQARENQSAPGPPPQIKENALSEILAFLLALLTGPWFFIVYPFWLGLRRIYYAVIIIFASPEFETKLFRIISFKIRRSFKSGQTIFCRVEINNPLEDMTVLIKELKAAPNLIIHGLISPGLEGHWLATGGRLKRGEKTSRMARLKLAAFFDGDRLYYDQNGLLSLCGYKKWSPFFAALFGLAVGFYFVRPDLSQAQPVYMLNCGLLLGLCAFIPALLALLAKKRILRAAEDKMKQSWPAYYNSLNLSQKTGGPQ